MDYSSPRRNKADGVYQGEITGPPHVRMNAVPTNHDWYLPNRPAPSPPQSQSQRYHRPFQEQGAYQPAAPSRPAPRIQGHLTHKPTVEQRGSFQETASLRPGNQSTDYRKVPEESVDNIPLELESWYFGRIDLERCVRVLGDPNVPFGTFLIRDSRSSQDTVCLSLKAITPKGPEICSIRITQSLNRQGQIQFKNSHDGRKFSSMRDLIKHYQGSGINIGDGVLKVGEGVKNTQHSDYNRSGDRFEIMASDITDTGDKLGEGNFGFVSKEEQWRWLHDVWSSTLDNMLVGPNGGFYRILRKPNGTTINVALKQLKNVNSTQVEAFKKEVDVLKMVYHDNIVTFYGVCVDGEGSTIMVTELMSKGELLRYLRKNKNLPLPDLLYFALKIASGMKFLESKKIVHRDLAARNVLLGEQHLVKINDFGMSRLTSSDDGIYHATRGPVPVKWTAPEGFRSKFTSKSDVWSFGIVLTEIVTYGNTPYKDISNTQIAGLLEHQGLRMTKRELGVHCSDEMYELMLACWQKDPAHRPTFAEVFDRMTDIYVPSAPLLYR